MDNRKTVSDIFSVTFSNILRLVAGVLVGFLLPKIIGVTDYGYYKTFTLYVTYIGLFHLGINDGIYLKYGGKDYKELNRRRFRNYLIILSLIEITISIIILIVSLILFDGEYRFIFISISVFLFLSNITSYFQYISQATRRFSELSFRNVVQSVCITLGVLIFAVLHFKYNVDISYRHYTLVYVFIFAVLMFWYLFTYREISFGNRDVLSVCVRDVLCFIKLGLPLMVANLCSSLILSLDRQFVSVLYDTNTYAIYAFAYHMLALVTSATSAVAVVLYPNLKLMDKSTLKRSMDWLIQLVLIIVYGGLMVYFPLYKFVVWYLPQYTESLSIFRIIFPGLAVSSAVTIVLHNYYKTIDKNVMFFKQSLCILIVSGVFNYIAYRIFKTTAAISWASIISLLLWYFVAESYFIKKYDIPWRRTAVYLITMMIAFYLLTLIENLLVAFTLYSLCFLVVTYVILNNTIRIVLKQRNKKL